MISLRPYQRGAVDRLYDELTAGQRRVMLQMPTGAGKTICAAQILGDARRRGRRCLFLAHRTELVDQCAEKLALAGVEGVEVATVQSFLVDGKPVPDAEVVVVDEAHVQHASKLLEEMDAPIVIGLTATPVRMNGKPMGNEYGALVHGPQPSELIAAGAIVPPVAYAPRIPDLRGYEGSAADYDVNEMAEEMQKPAVVGDVVKHWLTHSKREPTLVFACNKGHAAALEKAFREAGAVAESVFGTTNATIRSQRVQLFRLGVVDTLISVGVLTEGFDAPETRNVVLARPTKSLALYLQMCGRGARAVPGKTSYRLFDHVGAVLTHGLPHEDRTWALKKRPELAPRIEVGLYVCPNFHVLPARTVCPYCGVEPPKNARPVRYVDGQLVEVTEEYLRESRAEALRQEKIARQRYWFGVGNRVGKKGEALKAFVKKQMSDEALRAARQ